MKSEMQILFFYSGAMASIHGGAYFLSSYASLQGTFLDSSSICDVHVVQ